MLPIVRTVRVVAHRGVQIRASVIEEIRLLAVNRKRLLTAWRVGENRDFINYADMGLIFQRRKT